MQLFKILFVCLLAGTVSVSQAQTKSDIQRLAHVNITKVLESLPEYKAAEKKLQNFAAQLQQTLSSMEQEYTKKVQDYYDSEAEMLPAIKEARAQEITDLETRIVKLQGSTENQLMEKQMELLSPLEEKVMNAIDEVAAENGYTYVFDSSIGGPLLHYPESDDITEKIKAKLGVQ